MKTKTLASILFLMIIGINSFAQEKSYPESYGKTLNLGVGIGYYGYIGHSTPTLHLNYEFDLFRNFTLAPFVSIYTFQRTYIDKNGYRYNSRYTVIPVGAKGTYYFDELFNANSKWDFYAAGSLGFALVSNRADYGYYHDKNYYRSPSPVYLDLHIGAEYHINNRLGVFLDLSSGTSTIGLAIHH
ncbi:MAG: hypothetical protein H0V01_10505 [Bacteroidetes bacterium]|nr:hypothetical protein [Bacteroidota bacterium]HET6245090.1 hypothetical protein [Bacteroidia bacterium]